MSYPENVGIKAIEIYVPAQCLDQNLFEKYQGVTKGKYTVGLGLKYMNFCSDREDVCSLALTAVSSLLNKYNIDPKSIGRLEVGTESAIDKSKSVKTVLTQLFETSGNTNMEGIDTINACYGGTSALFNAVNWVESRSWDGRDAIVVASDIAIYKESAPRPTGGAGCVALLIGPEAPLSLIPNLRGTFMTHKYDFYKANFQTEYPFIDGYESLACYTRALDECYRDLRRRIEGQNEPPDQEFDCSTKIVNVLDLFDYMAFHAPICKIVSQSYGRLMYNDCLFSSDTTKQETIPEEFRNLDNEESLKNKELKRLFVALTKEDFETRVEPSLKVPSMCGNMYTASLYCSLISLISNIDTNSAHGKTIGMYSYGSGIASTLFGLKVTGDVSDIVQKLDIMKRLRQREIATVEDYEKACVLREQAYGRPNFTPSGDITHLLPGTYYLHNIDENYRRTYYMKREPEC